VGRMITTLPRDWEGAASQEREKLTTGGERGDRDESTESEVEGSATDEDVEVSRGVSGTGIELWDGTSSSGTEETDEEDEDEEGADEEEDEEEESRGEELS
jgi:hypothetical protein